MYQNEKYDASLMPYAAIGGTAEPKVSEVEKRISSLVDLQALTNERLLRLEGMLSIVLSSDYAVNEKPAGTAPQITAPSTMCAAIDTMVDTQRAIIRFVENMIERLTI